MRISRFSFFYSFNFQLVPGSYNPRSTSGWQSIMPGTVRYIGRKSPFRGNTLYWFAAHLRDLGIGRVVVRSKEANKFPEKCFYRITDMKPDFSHHDPVSVTKAFIFTCTFTLPDVTHI